MLIRTIVPTLLLSLTFLWESALAQTQPDRLPGWEFSNKNGILVPGVQIESERIRISTPVIAEIDGDTSNGSETAVASADGYVHVIKADGTILWSKPLPNATCTATDSRNKVFSSPAVGAIYGDGIPHIVIGYGGFNANACGGGVVALRGPDGQQRWHFNLKRFAERGQNQFFAPFYTVFSTPAIADTDGDGKMEIGFGAWDRNVYLLDHNGKLRWYYHTADTVWSSPLFMNVDNDPELEMVIGTDITKNNLIIPPTKNGGMVIALDTRRLPRAQRAVEFRDPFKRILKWARYLDQVIYSSPIAADVMSSASGEEIIVGTGCFFPEASSNKTGKYFAVVNARSGRILRLLQTGICSPSTAAAADLNGDGKVEIVVTLMGATNIGGDGQGRVMAFTPQDSASPIWTTVPQYQGKNSEDLGFFRNPVIADIDGNGSLEVLVSNDGGVVALAGETGEQLTCPTKAACTDRPTIFGYDTLENAPAVGDVNNDGKLDLVIAGGHFKFQSGSKRGYVYGFTNFSALGLSDPGPEEVNATPWPQFRRNAARIGR